MSAWEEAPRNLVHVQTFSHLNTFHCADEYLGRMSIFSFRIHDPLRTQQLSSIEQDQLQHPLSHAALIHFAFYESSIIEEKHASLGNRKSPSTSTRHQIFLFRKLLYVVLHPSSVLLLRTHQYVKHKFPSLLLVDALFLTKHKNAGYQTFPPRVRRPHLSRCAIVDVVNHK